MSQTLMFLFRIRLQRVLNLLNRGSKILNTKSFTDYFPNVELVLELGELFARDALERDESCGGHFREEYQEAGGEAKRDDDNYKYVAAWEYKGENQEWELHKEELKFDNVELKTRNYKD